MIIPKNKKSLAGLFLFWREFFFSPHIGSLDTSLISFSIKNAKLFIGNNLKKSLCFYLLYALTQV